MALINIARFKPFILAIFGGILLLSACASVQAPTGGPKDKEPPKVVRESPPNLSKNFNKNEILIEFNEFIKLKDEFKEITLSPAQERLPLFKIRKNVLEIKFQDSLEKNTTYTINFGKAIIDYNEGNLLKNYTYVFSTGNIIDSLSISGNVINALTKKPEIEIPVFIIPVRQDSIFGKKPANIFTTTDSSGNFSLNNLRQDTYRLYALKEQDGDRIYNSVNEEIAFLPEPIQLSKDISGLKLQIFKQEPAQFTTLDRRIEPDGRIFLNFNQSLANPSLKILSPAELDNIKTIEFSNRGDSAYLWLPEITFDSIGISVGNNETSLDTVLIRRSKRDSYNRTLTIRDNIINSGINNRSGLVLTFSSPVSSYDASKITLLDDSVALNGFQIVKDTSSLRKYKIIYPWRQGRNYTIRLADGAFTANPGTNKYYTNKFKLTSDDVYGDLILTVGLPDSNSYIVQLIKNETDVVKTNIVSASGKIQYNSIPVGKYSIRIIYDNNRNGKWDTGNVFQNRQPENTWNYEKIITLRPNWEIEESIMIPSGP